MLNQTRLLEKSLVAEINNTYRDYIWSIKTNSVYIKTNQLKLMLPFYRYIEIFYVIKKILLRIL